MTIIELGLKVWAWTQIIGLALAVPVLIFCIVFFVKEWKKINNKEQK